MTGPLFVDTSQHISGIFKSILALDVIRHEETHPTLKNGVEKFCATIRRMTTFWLTIRCVVSVSHLHIDSICGVPINKGSITFHAP